ncbi:MAG: TIGR03663 family protein [Roseiflexaceae bacterium]|nr:TIGR03663 family protein [Roseiflexaceae bacterium]
MSIAELPPQVTAPSGESTAPATTRSRTATISLEHAAYLVILLLAVISRLWGLGDRALHHDETLHAYFSWLVFRGEGYAHDPLLHGPFLYFFGALIYFLFSVSDATARLGPALFGIALVMLPYLLRRELGRSAALLASTYILISPAFMYIARFLRHDPYTILFELLALIGAVRYATTRRPLWLYVVALALAFMFVTMETFFLYMAIFAPLVALVFFWKVWKPGTAIVAALGIVVVALVFWLPGYPERPFPESDTVNRVAGPYICPSELQPFPPPNPMRVARPGPIFGWPPLATFDNNYALCVRHQPDDNFGLYFIKLGEFVSHPAILTGLVLVPTTLGALWWVVWRRRDATNTTIWERACASGDPTVATFASLGEGRRLLIAGGLFFLIYTLFFTAFLTNTAGVITGTTGSLLYWLAQHEVERGGQPPHYYAVLLAIYEPLLILWGVIGLAMAGVLGWRRLMRRDHNAASSTNGREFGADAAATSHSADPASWLPFVLVWWSIATFALYSWAGEKMPWLTVHVALPLTLLGAWAAGRTLDWWRRGIDDGQAPDSFSLSRIARPFPVFLALLTVISVYCLLLITVTTHTDTQLAGLTPWITPLWIVLTALLTAGAWMLRGRRWAIGALAAGVTLIVAAYTLRSAYQLSFRYGDIPREMMIYTQTSPDVKRVIDRLDEALRRRSSATTATVWYDNETVWDWYRIRFARAEEQPPILQRAPGDDVIAVLMLLENYENEQNRRFLEGFQVQRYPLRWWFPEDETYRLPRDWMTAPVTERSSLLMRMLRQPFDPRTSQQFWQYILYRVPPHPLGSTDFVVAVRPEVAPEMGLGFGGER